MPEPFVAFGERTWWRVRRLPSRLPRRSRLFNRTAPYPSELAALLRCTVFALLAVALLVLLAALVGHLASPVRLGGFVRAVVHTVRQPAVATPVAFLLLALCARLCRGARLAWLAWSPGPVVVSDFKAPSSIAAATPAQVSALFRKSLARLRLDPASPSPGATPEAGFLDILGAGGISSSDVLKTLVTLLRASWPGHAFEIEGTMQERDHPRGCGITVHAVRLPAQPAVLVEVWESSWEEAARSAADGAIAALLPRTRRCKGPWAAWMRYRPARRLFTAYRQAATLISERRYDEALECYRTALKLDPTNLTIALQQGQLQEKVGMFLGALTTYQRILALDMPGSKPLPSGLYRRAARREWARCVQIAKYRQIVLLGEVSVVREWCGRFVGEPLWYRRRLREYFRPELQALAVRRGDPAADAIADAIQALVEHEDAKVARVHRMLMPHVHRAAYELQRSLSRLESDGARVPISRRSVGLTLASIQLRMSLAEEPTRRQWPADLAKRLDSNVRWAGWRPGPWAGWRPVLLRRWTWQQHYNAACHYAIPLAIAHDARMRLPGAASAPMLDKTVRRELVRRAIGRLERAASRADNDFVATRGDWVLSEDPDLRGLRQCPEFKAFAATYFPDRDHSSGLLFGKPADGRRPQSSRPTVNASPARAAETIYAHDLLATVATRWHHLWHARACDRGADMHALLDWWSGETDIWHLFADVATNRHDWLRRQRLLRRSNEIVAGGGLPPIVASYHGLDGRWVRQIEADGAGQADGAAATHADARLCQLQVWLEAESCSPMRAQGAQLQRSLELLRRTDAKRAGTHALAQAERLCHHQAAVWQGLEEWLRGHVADDQDALEMLNGHLSDAAEAWALLERRTRRVERLRRALDHLPR